MQNQQILGKKMKYLLVIKKKNTSIHVYMYTHNAHIDMR